jgi:chromobox protein 1
MELDYSGTEQLREYYECLGGRDLVLKEGNKRTRSSDAKSRKKRKTTPSDNASFKPPTGNWEEEADVQTIEEKDGDLMALLHWSHGYKTLHPLDQVYKRCPQKVFVNA